MSQISFPLDEGDDATTAADHDASRANPTPLGDCGHERTTAADRDASRADGVPFGDGTDDGGRADVIALDPHRVVESDLLDDLEALVELGLVEAVVDTDGPVRFRVAPDAADDAA